MVKSIVYEHKKTERNEKTKKVMKEIEKYSDNILKIEEGRIKDEV